MLGHDGPEWAVTMLRNTHLNLSEPILVLNVKPDAGMRRQRRVARTTGPVAVLDFAQARCRTCIYHWAPTSNGKSNLTNNSTRFDLSDRLIHFFRDVDAEGPNAPDMPEHFAFNTFVEGTKYSAIFLLRAAIRSQTLWATWSKRKGVRTIYGPRPAVCFTEMPLAAFLESSVARARKGQAMATYALTFPKRKLFAAGANPVIYGLSDRSAALPPGEGGGPRIWPAKVLPRVEQYRYVTYAPTSTWPIDWTHEREWRWPYPGDISEYEKSLKKFGVVSSTEEVPSLDISTKELTGIGVIVRTRKEGAWVANDILTQVDRGAIRKTHFHHILVLDELPPPDELYAPDKTQAAIDSATISMDTFFDFQESEIRAAENSFAAMAKSVAKSAGPGTSSGTGGCWLWFPKGTSGFVRKLILAKRASVNSEGRYLAHLKEFDGRSREEREELTTELSKLVLSTYDVSSTYFSTEKASADSVPFWVGEDFLEQRSFYNRD